MRCEVTIVRLMEVRMKTLCQRRQMSRNQHKKQEKRRKEQQAKKNDVTGKKR